MKRVLSFLMSVLMLFCVLPAASAMEYLSRAENGMIVRIDAENGLSYYADFPKSALSGIHREDDVLIIEFVNGYIRLDGFYSGGRDARLLRFSDGSVITGCDFDETGRFTGILHTGGSSEKENNALRLEAAENPQGNYDYIVRSDLGGLSVVQGDIAVFGELKQLCIQKFRELCGDESVFRQDGSIVSLYLKDNGDSSLSAVRQLAETPDGFSITCTVPEKLIIKSTAELLPLADCRTTVKYENALGETVARFSVKVSGSQISLICPCCGQETDGKPHLLPCGHFFCMEGYSSEEHQQAECGIAGHCAGSSELHRTCDNCKGLLCDGKNHGSGYCQHKHEWHVNAYVPPTAEASGYSSSICLSCGAVYTEVLPAYGA